MLLLQLQFFLVEYFRYVGNHRDHNLLFIQLLYFLINNSKKRPISPRWPITPHPTLPRCAWSQLVLVSEGPQKMITVDLVLFIYEGLFFATTSQFSRVEFQELLHIRGARWWSTGISAQRGDSVPSLHLNVSLRRRQDILSARSQLEWRCVIRLSRLWVAFAVYRSPLYVCFTKYLCVLRQW